MNIFEILNRGKSRLHEPSMSAMLGYLLDSSEDHGFADTFLKSFLHLINNNSADSVFDSKLFNSRILVDVSLEEPYSFKTQRKDIDIQLSILNPDKEEVYRIIIENKIRSSSANPNQLSEYYQAILEDDSSIGKVLMVFVTPFSTGKGLQQEFDNLQVNAGHKKSWLFWDSPEDSIRSLLVDILVKESVGSINPINEYLRHTLKAFISYLDDMSPSKYSSTPRFNEDIGTVLEERKVLLDDKEYVIVRRDSQQIQVFDAGEKVVAKPILRKIIQAYNIEISDSDTYSLTTRQLGYSILRALE